MGDHMYSREEPFPVDWNAWRIQWRDWLADHDHQFGPSSYQFPSEKNFLADEILGKWSINGQAVELSEVTFTLGLNTKRYVGVTAGAASENDKAYIVETFAELEEKLGID